MQTSNLYAIIKIQKGKAIEAATPPNINSYDILYVRPSTIGSSWRLFLFFLENLINQIYKGYNEYPNLDQVLICNIHCIALLSLVWRAF